MTGSASRSYPERVRASRIRKNGAPMSAMTTPTGTSPTSRARRSAADRSTAPKSADSGTSRRAVGPTSRRTTCGTTSPTTDEPADGDRRGRRQRREPEEDPPLVPDVEAEVAGRRVTEQEPVEDPRSQREHQARAQDQRRGDEQARPRRPAETAEQEREDLAEVGPRDVHRHREQRGQHRADRVAGEQQPGEPAGRPGAADAEDEICGRERAREREPVQQPELDRHEADRDEDGDGRPEGGTGRGAEDVRVGQWIADQALERGAGDGESRAHQHGRQDPWHPQVPHDRLGGVGPGPPEVEAQRPPEDDADGVAGADPGRPERHPGDEQHRERDESRDGDQSRAPPDAPGQAERSEVGRERRHGHSTLSTWWPRGARCRGTCPTRDCAGRSADAAPGG